MIDVAYQYRFEYLVDARGAAFPILELQVMSSKGRDNTGVITRAYLDTGTLISIFDGEIAPEIGLDMLAGSPRTFRSIAGGEVGARLHRVRLDHEVLGVFELDIAFSTSRIRRNLLGRDWLNHIQVGFRERHLEFLVTPKP